MKRSSGKRSKVNWSSDHQNSVVLALPEKSEASTESGSCLSSTSTAASSARSHYTKRLMMKPRDDPEEPKRIRSAFGSGYLSSRAEAILKLLSSGCFSETRIRQGLGDIPSTSKALRVLLKQEVKKSGKGGRQDPFMYTIA